MSGRRIGVAVSCCPGDELSVLLQVVVTGVACAVEWFLPVGMFFSNESTVSREVIRAAGHSTDCAG